MQYLIRSFRKFIVPSLACTLLITTVLTVICFITVNNTTICNRIEIWIEACDYVDFFLPLIVSLAFSPFFYFINRKGFLKYAAIRKGQRHYLFTQYLVTVICVSFVVAISYYASLCISLNMTPETSISDNRLVDYVFGEYEINHPYLFGLMWCLYKGVVATLFVSFSNMLALYTDNLFVSVLGPFVYCMAENMITSLLNIPMYSIMTTYVLNRLSPSCMHVYNYVIGCFTYILITSGIIFIIRRKKNNVNVRI